MKKIAKGLTLMILVVALMTGVAMGDVIKLIDFETAGGYTTSVAEFTDNGTDYFTRTDGTNISSESFSNIQGSYYFAAQDTDGDGGPDYLTLSLDDVSINTFTGLSFSIYIAEDDDALEQDWDDDTYMHISYDIDNSGSYTNLIWVEAEGGTNSVPKIDTNFDGVGDGSEITSTFTKYTASIAGTGSTIDILIEFDMLDAGDEDIAIDNIEISGTAAGASASAPDATTGSASSISHNSATLNGTVDANLADATVTFEYGLTDAYGSSISAAESPITGDIANSVSASIASLSASTLYHFRVVAVNSEGTTYGDDATFSTSEAPAAPVVTTGSATNVLHNSATLNGTVDANSAESTVTFEYGLTDAYGSSITADESPITGTNTENVSVDLSGLTPSTTYHFRVKAVNSEGTILGDDVTFTTTATPATVNIFFSEYIEGSSNNKAIEIYNGSGSDVDLSNVSIKIFYSASTSAGATWTTTGTLSSGDVFVLANSNSVVAVTGVADETNGGSVVGFNGDDALGLYYDNVLVDMIGQNNGTDPGTAWDVAGITNATADHTLVRKASVTEGNTDWAASAGTTTENSEWIVYAQDTFDYLGASGEAPLPITLTSFTAKAQHGVVELAWETASETNNASFIIYRNNEVLATVEGAGTTSETNNYVYVDATVIPGVTYTYVLADVDYANTETKYEANAVTVTLGNDVVEADFVIGNAYPNPFNPTAIVPLTLSRDAVVNAKVYTLTGREVATLANGTMSAGSHELRITSDDMTTGLYLVRIEVENVLDVQKIAFVK